MTVSMAESTIAAELEESGIIVLPDFVCGDALHRMQEAFAAVLERQRWNDVDGYEKTEPYRHMVQNVLTLDRGFIDAALHPAITTALREYVGDAFQLVEAKGWKSMPTRRDFHGWHGDAWYSQTEVTGTIPREVKLGLYLTDVRSGFFEYLRGSHRKQTPRSVRNHEVADVPDSQVVRVKASAGSAFLFDTSGIHRQSVPMLEPRLAVFYNYHDPAVPLQREDLAYYRYHPLILNAAFLGGLDDEQRRILGFGDRRNYVHAFRRRTPYRRLHATTEAAHNLLLRADQFTGRVSARLRKVFGAS